jgi:quercetin 2,3-dioxygenase
MNKEVHRADSRGVADHGWLLSRHTFSFAGYRNPKRMGFGKLRVLNDDVVQPGAGFDTHAHDNMEIVSVPLSGALRHQDSMGNTHIIRADEVQLMSAGTGVTHSEYNHSDHDTVNFLQIWVLPKFKNIRPVYGQKPFPLESRLHCFQLVVSPDGREGSLRINQGAFFSLGHISDGAQETYRIHDKENGLYLFVIDGELDTAGEKLAARDAVGLTDIDRLAVTAKRESKLLLIEVPMR